MFLLLLDILHLCTLRQEQTAEYIIHVSMTRTDLTRSETICQIFMYCDMGICERVFVGPLTTVKYGIHFNYNILLKG